MKKLAVLTVYLALMVLAGCSKTEPEARSDSASAAPTPPVSTDTSLELTAYSERGVPLPDHPWDIADYQAALEALSALAEERPLALPRYHSPASGEIFRRMVNLENMEPPADSSLEQLMQVELEVLKAITALQLLYGDRRLNYQTESIEFIACQLDVFVRLLESTERVMERSDREDPAWAVRVDGVRRQFESLGLGVVSALSMFAVPSHEEHDLVRLAGRLEHSLPRILHVLDHDTRSLIMMQLDNTINARTKPSLRQALTGLRAAIDAYEAPPSELRTFIDEVPVP